MTYTHGHAESVLRSHRSRTAANSAAYLLPHLAAGQRLLDVGSGPGTITADLVRAVAPGEVVAVEIDQAAAALTRTELLAQQCRATVEVGDVTRLRYDDASFDVCHAHQVLQHVADPVGALTELRRVTRPDGLVAARDSDYSSFAWYPASAELDRWLQLYQRAARANGGEPDAGRRLLSWAHRAGFENVWAGSSTWCYADPSSRTWWAELWADRFTGSAVAEQIRTAGWATQGDLEDIAAGWRRWAADPGAWFSVHHGEILARA